ncbi:MAG: hypothetical protein L6R39_004078 [Caloplaca ligustica]|nr:MAG: hypothetical protein L6R39_004078 [Caloplaca ligustica]
MADGEQAGLLDLEKELTCSICTEVLFQPLTLLDCLHTFCGSCLKEWFSSQASQASTDRPNPYTCPSCRASVRDTRPNSTVTTLLDMYLQANPRRRRSEEEKEELKRKFKPGEPVLPHVTLQDKDSDDERMLAEVREMSLREVGVRAPDSYERGTRHRTAERRRHPSDNVRRSRGQQQTHSTQQGTSTTGAYSQIGHQSSLRSLMSSSDIDSEEMEREIQRLVDEGWLDGIDLNTLDMSQVDELSERIADAYRRRHGLRSGVRSAQPEAARRSHPHSLAELLIRNIAIERDHGKIDDQEVPLPKSRREMCNNGDYNICTNSYLKLISTGRISVENGDKGWRRCPNGHRMIILGFEDSSAGQKRVIVQDLVGGYGLKDNGNNPEQSMKQEWSWHDGDRRHTRTVSKSVAANEPQDNGGTGSPLRPYPPSGGLGLHVLALWSYWPRDEAQDELPFPKGAEIRETENINGDWFVGRYAGRTGLFPGNYVRVLGR